MKKIGTTSSGSVIIEMTQVQFDALSQLHACTDNPPTPQPVSTPTVPQVMTMKDKVEFVRPRLAKLKPKKKDGVIKSIAAMFQFTGGICANDIEKIISTLAKEGYLSVGPNDQIEYKQ